MSFLKIVEYFPLLRHKVGKIFDNINLAHNLYREYTYCFASTLRFKYNKYTYILIHIRVRQEFALDFLFDINTETYKTAMEVSVNHTSLFKKIKKKRIPISQFIGK